MLLETRGKILHKSCLAEESVRVESRNVEFMCDGSEFFLGGRRISEEHMFELCKHPLADARAQGTGMCRNYNLTETSDGELRRIMSVLR